MYTKFVVKAFACCLWISAHVSYLHSLPIEQVHVHTKNLPCHISHLTLHSIERVCQTHIKMCHAIAIFHLALSPHYWASLSSPYKNVTCHISHLTLSLHCQTHIKIYHAIANSHLALSPHWVSLSNPYQTLSCHISQANDDLWYLPTVS
jgi:hypothetical protein